MPAVSAVETIKFKATRLLSRVLSARQVTTLAKYIYIKNMLQHYQIDLVLDIGANVGQFASSLRDIGYRGDILSFEPVSSVYDQLAAAARGDERWKTYPFALGETPTRQAINVMASSAFSSFNMPSVAETSAFEEGNTVLRTEDVQVRRLDEFVATERLAARLGRCFIKCDTQGFDLHVLRGAGDELARMRMIQLEVGVTRIYADSPGMAKMMQFLDQQGFAPVSFFPIARLPDWSTAEFDYLAVKHQP